MTNEYPCVRITFHGNVIYSERFTCKKDNETFAKSVLLLLLGYDPWNIDALDEESEFDTYGGKIEYYNIH